MFSIGISVNMHFYGSELYSIALFGEAPSCCDEPCDYCHNEGFYYILDSEFIVGQNIDFEQQWIDIFPLFDVFQDILFLKIIENSTDIFRPSCPPFLICWQPDLNLIQRDLC